MTKRIRIVSWIAVILAGSLLLILVSMFWDSRDVSISYDFGENAKRTEGEFFYDKVPELQNKYSKDTEEGAFFSLIDEAIKGSQDEVYYIKYYQKDDKLYGVCNVLQDTYRDDYMLLSDITKGCFWVYDLNERKMEYTYLIEDAYAVLTDSETIVYVKKDNVYRYNYRTGEAESIYSIINMDKNSMSFRLKDEKITICEHNSWTNEKVIEIDLQ